MNHQYRLTLSQIPLKAWIIWLIAGLFYLFEFMHRIGPGVMAEELMMDFSASAVMLGSLSAYYYYAYASMQIPVGLLLDRFAIHYLLSFAALLVGIGSYMFSVTETLWIANISRCLIGLGSAFSFVGCLKIGATWFPARFFALIVGLTNFLGVSGAILGGKPLAQAVDHWDWRIVMQWSSVIGFLFTVILFVAIRDKFIPSKQTRPSFKTNLLQVLHNPKIWLYSIYGSLMVAPIAIYAELWGVSYLMQRNELDKSQAAHLVSLVFVGIAIGGPSWGWLASITSRRHFIMLLGATGALLSTMALLFLPWLSMQSLYSLQLTFGFFSSSMLLCFTLNVQQQPTAQATVIGFTNTIIMAASAFFQPLAGAILDKIADQPIGNIAFTVWDYQIALSLMPICQATALLILIVGLYSRKTP